jgi:hypothetical protein
MVLASEMTPLTGLPPGYLDITGRLGSQTPKLLVLESPAADEVQPLGT